MSRIRISTGIVVLLTLSGNCLAEREKTDGNSLADAGIEFSLSGTQIYQQNVHGGISTYRKAGRFSGSYDIELSADMQKLLGIENGRLYMLTEGSYSNGIDGPSVGSFLGVNDDAAGNRSVDVTELWYEHSFLEKTLLIRAGKIDLTGGFECRGCPVSFDGSAYANDETTQFLNSALVNNSIIPFPDNGLAIVVHYNPVEHWYASAAVADAQADVRETGFNTAFSGQDYFFYIFETGITPRFNCDKGPLQGAYRAGLWYDPQPKANTDYADAGKSYRDDLGFYLSCDQMLIKENTNPEDSQGLGVFFRLGYADSRKNDLEEFRSIGFQYQGLFDNRDDDVLGVGFAQGVFSDKAHLTYTADYESVIETYYSVVISPNLSISPSFQYIARPGGTKNADDAVVLGARLQICF